jgi:lipopolysaccharide/colanic/teichoic acid biosynthesis glycosyltransferase
MTPQKRALDIILAVLLIIPTIPVLLILMAVLLIIEGRPLFYVSERMKTPTRGFALVKLRTMRVGASDGGVTGGNKSNAIPPVFRALRKSRLDELPQLWNVLRGDMSFVGPRPPLRTYVDDFPAIYNDVLRNRPGITGLASLRFHEHEEQLLAACDTPAQTDHVYRTRCVPRKAALDLIYQRHGSRCFDRAVGWETARKPFTRN